MAAGGDLCVDVTVHLCVRECGRSCTKHDFPFPRIRVQEFYCHACGDDCIVVTDIDAKPVFYPEADPSRPCVLPEGHRWHPTQRYYR